MTVELADFLRMYVGWYLYIFILTVLFALPLPYIGGGRLINWKGWLLSGMYFTVVMAGVVFGVRAYCSATRDGFDILGCGIGILVTTFVVNAIVGAAIMWYTRRM